MVLMNHCCSENFVRVNSVIYKGSFYKTTRVDYSILYGKSRLMLCDAYKTINIALPFVTQKDLESLSGYTRLSVNLSFYFRFLS